MCNRPPTEYWKPPNSAFVEVLLPDRATPMKPMTGARMRNAGPIWAKPCASVFAMPEKLNTVASPKITGVTISAPHIWAKVSRNMPGISRGWTRSATRMTSQDTRIQVPATAGEKDQETSVALPDSELIAVTAGLAKL